MNRYALSPAHPVGRCHIVDTTTGDKVAVFGSPRLARKILGDLNHTRHHLVPTVVTRSAARALSAALASLNRGEHPDIVAARNHGATTQAASMAA